MVPMLIGMSDRGPDSAGMAVFTPPLPEGRCKLSLYSGLTAPATPTTGPRWSPR
jgi:hypothetical protein